MDCDQTREVLAVFEREGVDCATLVSTDLIFQMREAATRLVREDVVSCRWLVVVNPVRQSKLEAPLNIANERQRVPAFAEASARPP